ncbi:MAG: hypothetical protein L0Y58_00965, partial [Verrucomicrobia subdivision 3 bacterium]|nr:hypothetical protein [Limisphaerales bacterium]
MKSCTSHALCLRTGITAFSLFLVAVVSQAAMHDIPERSRTRLEARFAEVLREAGPTKRHFEAPQAGELSLREQEALFRQLQAERFEGKWVAALVSERPEIVARFETWKGLAEFLTEREALIEIWAYSEEGTANARRLTAREVAELKRAEREQPTFLTATYRVSSGAVQQHRIEWGLFAAASAAADEAGYARYREMQFAVRRALGARDERRRITPRTQWEALNSALREGRISVRQMPPRPVGETNLFLAVEYEVDASGNGTNIASIYRESEIKRRIILDKEGRGEQLLELRRGPEIMTALGFRVRPGTDLLEPAPSPVLGQDNVELRIRNIHQPDPRRWNLVEFGEPELIRQSALAQFSLISAHLERQRKAIGVKKSNLDLIAEPVIAAINIGTGVAGVPFAWGEAVRLAYNLITPKYIAEVPTVKELRELFALLAAKERDPILQKKLPQFLAPEDIKALEEKAATLTEREIDEFARSVSDEDLQAMVFLARMRRIDARVTNLLNILTSAAKISGGTDSGLLREIFNNSYVGLNGEWSIKNSLAAILGEDLINSRNSVPLEDLVRGRGPDKAWAQYFDFSVDLRALMNTIGRIPRRNFAERELYKPLPYALHLGDLAAYEIRVFGFPLFIFYKRGLIKDDFRAYQEDYAYGIDGAKILEHFRTREEMDREIRAGRMAPIGYVKVPDGRGGWNDSNLAIFTHRIPTGRHKGKLVIVIYGLKAYADHSQVIERELKRLRQFEKALEEGGVIEQVIDADQRDTLPVQSLEPILHVGPAAVEQMYAARLAKLLEDQRERRRAEWGLPGERQDADKERLVSADRFYSSFIFQTTDGAGARAVRMTLIPALDDVERSARKAEQAKALEE